MKMGIEQAKELKYSTLWETVKKELDVRIESCLAQLKQCTIEELPKIQLRIKTFEEVKNLPQDVIYREEDPGT